MALSTRDADAMNEAAKKAGRKLAVCFQNRFNAPVQKLRTALEVVGVVNGSDALVYGNPARVRGRMGE
jgi:predicted dehydrogenase